MKWKCFGVILLIAVALLAPGIRTIRAAQSDTLGYGNDPRVGEGKDDLSDKFTFTRVMFGGPVIPGEELGDQGPMWSHDYPDGGLHFSKILSELSRMRVTLDTPEKIFRFSDPNLFKYPFAYLCEVGYIDLTEEEVRGMREYLTRGGFLIVDDFRGPYQFRNFLYTLGRAFPNYQLKKLDITHPIFNCFFSIKTLDVKPPYGRFKPEFYGVEDKHGRLMMVINYNNDVSDFWQWSNQSVY
ncbi:MAG TPA: DUF4159 domain-containing protein, partial [Blastocatellia bacterium]|nr:DUF4159 domain-containing protein [Blastocatellia bacterium]